MKLTAKWIVILMLISITDTFAQNDHINFRDPVYAYLYRQFVLGTLPDYDPTTIPKTRKQITYYLNRVAATIKEEQNHVDELLLRIMERPENLSGGINKDLFFGDSAAHPIFYTDSLLTASLDAYLSSEVVTLREKNYSQKQALFFTYGATAVVQFPFNVSVVARAWNGSLYGDREAGVIDPRIRRSFTFIKTGLNNFDGTEGYILHTNSLLTIQFGREKLIRGISYQHPLRFGYEAPMFDFFRADLRYKQFGYEFLHGWLNEQPVLSEIAGTAYKVKQSKFIASSLATWKPTGDFSLGISQTIIYSGRSMEAAYLNPFMFWESAQRSLNDIDNSYLSLQTEYLPVNGVRLYYQMLMDDINFNVYKKEGFNSVSNMGLYQLGGTYSFSHIPVTLGFDFMEIRPFVFSHPGHGLNLAYTNNAEPLGVTFEPNSRVFSLLAEFVQPKFHIKAALGYLLHGRNEYDDNGVRIRNVGGEYSVSYDLTISRNIPTLSGIREEKLTASLELKYQLSYNLSASFYSVWNKFIKPDSNNSLFIRTAVMYGYR